MQLCEVYGRYILLLTDATDRSKISSDHNQIRFKFSRTLPLIGLKFSRTLTLRIVYYEDYQNFYNICYKLDKRIKFLFNQIIKYYLSVESGDYFTVYYIIYI